jgi:hypothetical protein
MNCSETQANLTLLILKDVTGKKAEELAAHLEGCQTCREERDRLAKALDDLRSLPELPASPDRVKRILAQAPKGRNRPVRRLTMLLGVAASVLLAVALVGTFVTPDASLPTPVKPRDILSRTPVRPPVGHVSRVTGEGRLMKLTRTDGGQSFPLEKGLPIWVGDRIVSQDAKARIVLRFTSDALQVTLEGKTSVVLQGSDEENYYLELDAGRLTGWFPQAVESLDTRKGPFMIKTPVAMAEIIKGQGFSVSQDKVDLLLNDRVWMEHPREGTISTYFPEISLSKLVEDYLQRSFSNRIAYNPALLRGKISLICKNCPRAMFIDLFDESIAHLGLSIRRDGSMLRIEARPVKAPAWDVWKSFTYGAFTVEVAEKGSAKLTSLSPEARGALMLTSGQVGTVRPGAAGRPRALTVLVARKVKLRGTFGGAGLAGAEVEMMTPDGVKDRRVVRQGDIVDGYRVSWIWWDRLTLEKDGREFLLVME